MKKFYFPYFNNATSCKPRKPGGYAAFGEGIGANHAMIPPAPTLCIQITGKNIQNLMLPETLVVKTTSQCVLRDGWILTTCGDEEIVLDKSRKYIWFAAYNANASMYAALRVWCIDDKEREYYEATWDEYLLM